MVRAGDKTLTITATTSSVLTPVMYANQPAEVDLQYKFPKLDDDTRPSSLFSYYNACKAAGEEDADDGCTIRTCLKQASQLGFASNLLWPFAPDKVAVEPSSRRPRCSTRPRPAPASSSTSGSISRPT